MNFINYVLAILIIGLIITTISILLQQLDIDKLNADFERISLPIYEKDLTLIESSECLETKIVCGQLVVNKLVSNELRKVIFDVLEKNYVPKANLSLSVAENDRLIIKAI